MKGSIDYLKSNTQTQINKIIQYLKDNQYIDLETNKLLKKGIMASEISECNEIILTEIVTNDFFTSFTARRDYSSTSSIY